MSFRFFPRMLALATCMVGLVLAQTDEIDWAKAKQLHQRVRQGEKLTEEEQAYYERAKALRSKAGPDRRPSQPVKPPVGLKPLTDMTANRRGVVHQARSMRQV